LPQICVLRATIPTASEISAAIRATVDLDI
jgi:hypothetical protein